MKWLLRRLICKVEYILKLKSTKNFTWSPLEITGMENVSESGLQISGLGAAERRILSGCLGVIIIHAFLGNLIVVIVFRTYKPLRRITNSFMVSLAVSDMLVGAVGMPLWILNLNKVDSDEWVSFQ